MSEYSNFFFHPNARGEFFYNKIPGNFSSLALYRLIIISNPLSLFRGFLVCFIVESFVILSIKSSYLAEHRNQTDSQNHKLVLC